MIGVNKETFIIQLSEDFDISKIKFEIGKDIKFISKPVQVDDGWSYKFKAISEKSKKYFNIPFIKE